MSNSVNRAAALRRNLTILTLLIAELALSGCMDPFKRHGSADSNNAATANQAPQISGTPPDTVQVGAALSFVPTALDPENKPLTFSVANLPGWAQFDSATGQISGTPQSSDVGRVDNVTISVSDGLASASLTPFNIAVVAPLAAAPLPGAASATLSWEPPTENEDGSPLTDLAGFKIYYGNSPDALTQAINITDSTTLTYIVASLTPGTWFFAIAALSASGAESAQSVAVSKTVT